MPDSWFYTMGGMLGLTDYDVGLLTYGELISRINCYLIFQGYAEEDVQKTEEEMFPDWD